MSVTNLIMNENVRLLKAPWQSGPRSWSENSLRDTRKLIRTWEDMYATYKQRVRHHNEDKKPVLPTFAKVEQPMISLMLTWGGKSMINIKFNRNNKKYLSTSM